MDSRSLGTLVVAIGVGVVGLGLLIMTGALGWFGRLPGDIRIEREGTRLYVPLVSMLIVSVLLSILISLFRRFL